MFFDFVILRSISVHFFNLILHSNWNLPTDILFLYMQPWGLPPALHSVLHSPNTKPTATSARGGRLPGQQQVQQAKTSWQ